MGNDETRPSADSAGDLGEARGAEPWLAGLPSPAVSTRARRQIDDRERNHIAAIAEAIREFDRDRRGKGLLPYEQKCELLAKIHEEFSRPDMALERRREAKCRNYIELGWLHLWGDGHKAGREPEYPPFDDRYS